MIMAAALLLFSTTYECDLVKILDGDTISVYCDEFPEPFQKLSIRAYGLDTPESNYLAKCKKEKKLGVIAKARVKLYYAKSNKIKFKWAGTNDKYGGRLLTYIKLPDGSLLNDKLITDGLARPYDGGTKSNWCK